MKRIALTQRVEIIPAYGERRDALDQRWSQFLLHAGLWPIIVPNDPAYVEVILKQETFDGLLLTGGNSLVRYGGEALERDEIESRLLNYAIARKLPVLGVCRGMQMLLDRYGATLQQVSGHTVAQQEINIEGRRVQVNSYHDWGTCEAPSDLEVWARADDGVVKAVRHRRQSLWGIMWHPERCIPFRFEDLALVRRVFDVGDNA